jgi:hypothetical protein
LADLILGKVDGLDVEDFGTGPDVLADWYQLLNAGFLVPLVGGSGKWDCRTALGRIRTYARLGPMQSLIYGSWIEAVRAGRTFVTMGPLLSFQCNGVEPGGVLELLRGMEKVRIRAEATSAAAFERLEVVANGVVISGAAAQGQPARALVEAELAMPGGGWLAARCVSDSKIGARGVGTATAHTSAVGVRVKSVASKADPTAVAMLKCKLRCALDWLGSEGVFENIEQRERLTGILECARRHLDQRQA